MERFEDIVQIDTEPFDTDVLEEIYVRPYATEVYMTDCFALLMFHYFQIFDKRYGTHIAGGLEIGRTIGYNDDLDFWYLEAASLLENAMYDCGWCVEPVSTEFLKEYLADEDRAWKDEDYFQQGYRRCLDTVLDDCFLKDVLLAEWETAMDAIGRLEEGYLVIVWNPELHTYMQFREEHSDVIEAACKGEDQWIIKLEEDIWEPYMAFYECKKREISGKSYCSVELGCDGYSFVSFEAINPNRICRAVKLYKMLQLANEKIERFRRESSMENAA